MRMRLSTGLLLLLLAGRAGADPTPADCVMLTAALRSLGDYSLTAPPAGDEAGWCVLDQADLRASDLTRPDIHVDRLRLRGSQSDGALVALEIDAAGLRVKPKLGDRTMDDRLRAMLRLQSAEVQLTAEVDPASTTLLVQGMSLRLSGGTELTASATIAGAGLSLASLAGGRLTALDLDWRNDGRLLRPVMELAGERLTGGKGGSPAIDAARQALGVLADSLPDALFDGEDSRAALDRLILALPQGRGRLTLALTAPEGLGASRLLLAAMADDPQAAPALARLFAGVSLRLVWQPGLAP